MKKPILIGGLLVVGSLLYLNSSIEAQKKGASELGINSLRFETLENKADKTPSIEKSDQSSLVRVVPSKTEGLQTSDQLKELEEKEVEIKAPKQRFQSLVDLEEAMNEGHLEDYEKKVSFQNATFDLITNSQNLENDVTDYIELLNQHIEDEDDAKDLLYSLYNGIPTGTPIRAEILNYVNENFQNTDSFAFVQ